MLEHSNGKSVYGVQYLKKQLTDRYGQHVSFCNKSRRDNVIFFKVMGDFFVKKMYGEKKEAAEREEEETTKEQCMRIQTIAAKLIQEEIRRTEF